MSDKKENALVLYAKYPRPGEVKTRLSQGASGLTAIEASNLYLAILKDLFLTINNPDNPFKLYICALSHETAFRESFGQYLQFLPDEGDGDLGLSLYRTFQIMKQRDYKKVIIMGSDLPLITTQDLIHGFRQLETQSFVLGPDQSGGCYVIGARDAYPLFHEIPWSEGRDFHILKNRVLSQSIDLAILPEVEDIDTMDDFYRLKNRFQKEGDKLQISKPNLYRFFNMFHVKQ